jgi:hypothetical protein
MLASLALAALAPPPAGGGHALLGLYPLIVGGLGGRVSEQFDKQIKDLAAVARLPPATRVAVLRRGATRGRSKASGR